VRCAAGANPLTVTIVTTNGVQSVPLVMNEDQVVPVAGRYWIRCLAHDFPDITVTTHADAGAPTPGLYLLNSWTFAAVLDTNGSPVWYERGVNMMNLNAPAVDTLSFMPEATDPFGDSLSCQFVLYGLDSATKETIAAVGAPTDGHELQTLANGDHLLFAYPLKQGVDLTGLAAFGAAETMADCEIQEIDPSGKLVWSWLASDHVDPIQESMEPATDTIDGGLVVDVFHCNSIEVDSSGNLLISMRQANAVFYIDRSTGKVQWKLGGSPYNKDGAAYVRIEGDPQTAFRMQHDARFQPNGHVSLFDDHGGADGGVARGVEYAIDHTANTAAVAWQFLGIGQSQYEGSCRRYADGDTVIGWGYIPSDPRTMTEVDSKGSSVLDIAFSETNRTYRAVKVPLSQLDLGVLRKAAAR
jgi:hypothetical protein